MLASHFSSRFSQAKVLTGALAVFCSALAACGGEAVDFENIDAAELAVGPGGSNNIPPFVFDSDPLSRGVTNNFGITSPSIADPRALCEAGTITATQCTMKSHWEDWLDADPSNRAAVMKGIAKCAVGSDFAIHSSDDGYIFPGQWSLYPSWKNNRLTGQDKRERISSCILSLLNGNDSELDLCIIGPGGAPFSDACAESIFSIREGGFFGDLFATNPTAYVAGPDTSDPLSSGRACFANGGIYCCAENDSNCNHRIVLAGAILGSPEQNFANKRCNAALVNSGGNAYCPSFFSTREPGRSYTNVFTSFVPPAE